MSGAGRQQRFQTGSFPAARVNVSSENFMRKPHARKGKGPGYAWLKEHTAYQGNDCLAWPFSKDPRIGRGFVTYLSKRYWAHRLMCILTQGEPPTPKHHAAHNCGNGHLGCVNPRHLEWKTNQENSVDRELHGRGRKPGGKRIPAEVLARLKSRKGKQTQVATAAEFGVSLSLVQYHWHGKERWPSHRKETA